MKIWARNLFKKLQIKQMRFGDGTTTATVLAQSMIQEGLKNVTSGANPVGLRQGIDKAVKVAVEALHDISQKLKTKMKLHK